MVQQMVSHTADNTDTFTTEQQKKTLILSKFSGIYIPKQVVEEIKIPPRYTFRSGNRVLVGKSSLNEEPVFKEVIPIGVQGEFEPSY